MNRNSWNIVIDAATFALFAILASTGFMLSYLLPPGSGGGAASASGHHAAEKTVALVWGLTRHEWGRLHYWLAIGVLALLAIHLALHWKWLVCTLQNKKTRRYSGFRLGVGLVSLLAVVALVIAPYLGGVEHIEARQLQTQSGAAAAESAGEPIRGSMTFQEVAAAYGTTVPQLLEHLELPADTPPEETLGRSMRREGRELRDVRHRLDEVFQPR